MSSGSNLEKHTSKNPLVKFLNNRLKPKPKNILDAGCGEGFTINMLANSNDSISITGLDIEKDALEYAKGLNPKVKFFEGSVYELPFDDNQFDVVILSEVLEHLENPSKALSEIYRVSSGYCVISVPNEPIFRLGNMARLTYLSDYGNTPGHINHWSKKSFIELISKIFEVEEVKVPLPWVSALCKKR
jgi:ubiquinone/menaquinone biosynthesis C-methylase UbiE